MKMNKFTLLLMVIIGAVLFTACGSKEDPAAKEKQDETAENEENVKAVVKAIGDGEIRFPAFIEYDGILKAVETNARINDTTYGFDNPETGISIYAFAEQNGLNEEQASAIDYLINFKVVDENGNELSKIGEYYPEDFDTDIFPYKGADIDYFTLTNVETKPSDEDDKNLQITADLNVHLHLIDGTEEVRTYKTSTVPKAGDTPLNENMVKNAFSADKMNEKLPNEERYSEKGAN